MKLIMKEGKEHPTFGKELNLYKMSKSNEKDEVLAVDAYYNAYQVKKNDIETIKF